MTFFFFFSPPLNVVMDNKSKLAWLLLVLVGSMGKIFYDDTRNLEFELDSNVQRKNLE